MNRHLALFAALLAFVAGCTEPVKPTVEPRTTELPAQGFHREAAMPIGLDNAKSTAIYLTPNYIIVYTDQNQALGFTRKALATKFRVQVTDPKNRLFAPVDLGDWLVFPTDHGIECRYPNGSFMQTLQPPFSIRSNGAGEGTMLYIGGDYPNGGRLAAINTAITGQSREATRTSSTIGEIWTARGSDGSGFIATPAVWKDTVFTGTRSGYVYGMNLVDGHGMWVGLRDTDYGFYTRGEVIAPLAADDSGVYAACGDEKVYCLDVNTGALQWTYYAQGALVPESGPVLTKELCYIYIPGRGVAALDKTTVGVIKKHRWIVEDAVQFLAQDTVNSYLLDRTHHIMAVDKKTGEVKFRSKRDDFVRFASNRNDPTIYGIAEDGMLYAIRVNDAPGTMGEVVMVAPAPIH